MATAIYIRVSCGAEERHVIPPDVPGSGDDVIGGIMKMWKAGERIMLPDGTCYEREQVMGFRSSED